jgi:hypothetical protein
VTGIWCLAPSPPIFTFDEVLGRPKPPPGYDYGIPYGGDTSYVMLCYLPPDHEGVHGWAL